MPVTAPYLLGLTGSIGMGKSTAAAEFARRGIPVWDADAAVHRLYAPGGAAVAPVAALCPEAARDGAIDRARLGKWIAAEPERLKQIEAVVHPLVARDREEFVRANKAQVVVFDIPLLFETGAESWMDGVAVVSTDAETQRDRVMRRPGMTEAMFELILGKQIPDAEKRRRATFTIPSDTPEAMAGAIDAILKELQQEDA